MAGYYTLFAVRAQGRPRRVREKDWKLLLAAFWKCNADGLRLTEIVKDGRSMRAEDVMARRVLLIL